MSKIELFVQGHEELKRSYYQKSVRLKRSTDRELLDIGKLLKTYVTKRIKRITGSRTEVRYNPKRTVRVSNPKAYPNHDRGKLVKGIRTTVRFRGRGLSLLEFQSRAPYALDLEFGTRKMAKRPYMKPTLEANKKKISKMLSRSTKRAL